MPFNFPNLSPALIINEAMDSVQERFEQPGCRLEVDIAENLPSITADADALVTVVLNLLDNAYKYTGDEKTHQSAGIRRKRECVHRGYRQRHRSLAGGHQKDLSSVFIRSIAGCRETPAAAGWA